MKVRNLFRPLYLLGRLHLKAYEIRHPNEPWISARAVRFCEKILNPTMSAFEWGSGRSTTWFAQRLGHITSIENDAVWYEQVQETLKHVKISNVSLKLVPLEHAYADLYFPYYDPLPHYVEAISEVADESLDFVVVDGHYRQACTWLAMRKIKPGGYLLIDNTDWLPREQWPVPFAWPIVHQSRNVLTQTTLWQKPAQDSPVKV